MADRNFDEGRGEFSEQRCENVIAFADFADGTDGGDKPGGHKGDAAGDDHDFKTIFTAVIVDFLQHVIAFDERRRVFLTEIAHEHKADDDAD